MICAAFWYRHCHLRDWMLKASRRSCVKCQQMWCRCDGIELKWLWLRQRTFHCTRYSCTWRCRQCWQGSPRPVTLSIKCALSLLAEAAVILGVVHGHGCTNCLIFPIPVQLLTFCQKAFVPCFAPFMKNERLARRVILQYYCWKSCMQCDYFEISHE